MENKKLLQFRVTFTWTCTLHKLYIGYFILYIFEWSNDHGQSHSLTPLPSPWRPFPQWHPKPRKISIFCKEVYKKKLPGQMTEAALQDMSPLTMLHWFRWEVFAVMCTLLNFTVVTVEDWRIGLLTLRAGVPQPLSLHTMSELSDVQASLQTYPDTPDIVILTFPQHVFSRSTLISPVAATKKQFSE